MSEGLMDFVQYLRDENAEWVSEAVEAFGEVTVIVPAASIVDICFFSKDKARF